MRIFLDTNVLLEYICKRERAEEVEQMVDFAIGTGIPIYVSSGSVYTMAYVVEKHLKANGLNGERKREVLRNAISNMLSVVNIANIGNNDFTVATNDENFLDLEDSFQYQAAITAKCNVLATFNTKDFPPSTDNLQIMTPADFLSTILP